jgi:hypothetical protein
MGSKTPNTTAPVTMTATTMPTMIPADMISCFLSK